ncbi:MAG: sugar phosphate isomerase/epimerase [Planctomycetes bacterium]|nr:sugar phosphate isomerase/epimerase [Planctomycetota bacterium]
MSNSTRRDFLTNAATVTGAGLIASDLGGQQPPQLPRNEPPQRYRLGIVTYNIAATWDLTALLRICRAVGLSPVELRTTHRHGVEPTLTADQRRDVRRRFQDAGIEIWGCGTVCEFHSPDPAVVRRNIDSCRQFCQLVADIGGRGVKVRPNDLPAGVTTERTLDQIGRSLRECGRAASDAGVEIWVEVHGRGTAHPPHMATMMRAADHASVGVTWNSNQTDVVNGSVAEYFRLLRPWIKSCHINELHSGYPYRELFRLLRETNYDRVCLAEIQGMPDEATGERLMRYYKMLWTELASPRP